MKSKTIQIEIESFGNYRAYDDIRVLINLNYIHLIQIDQFLKVCIPYSYSIILGYNISSDYTVCYVVYLFNEYL